MKGSWDKAMQGYFFLIHNNIRLCDLLWTLIGKDHLFLLVIYSNLLFSYYYVSWKYNHCSVYWTNLAACGCFVAEIWLVKNEVVHLNVLCEQSYSAYNPQAISMVISVSLDTLLTAERIVRVLSVLGADLDFLDSDAASQDLIEDYFDLDEVAGMQVPQNPPSNYCYYT